jgi:hypothetical protein
LSLNNNLAFFFKGEFMKKLSMFVLTMLVGASLAVAQAGGGSTAGGSGTTDSGTTKTDSGTTKTDSGTTDSGTKTSKKHKGKKGKKAAGDSTTTTPEPK